MFDPRKERAVTKSNNTILTSVIVTSSLKLTLTVVTLVAELVNSPMFVVVVVVHGFGQLFGFITANNLFGSCLFSPSTLRSVTSYILSPDMRKDQNQL